VLSEEPPTEGNVLLNRELPNLIVTPHIAWASDQAMRALADQLTSTIEAWAEGRACNLVG
jgi:glycerate dehydrogenase